MYSSDSLFGCRLSRTHRRTFHLPPVPPERDSDKPVIVGNEENEEEDKPIRSKQRNIIAGTGFIFIGPQVDVGYLSTTPNSANIFSKLESNASGWLVEPKLGFGLFSEKLHSICSPEFKSVLLQVRNLVKLPISAMSLRIPPMKSSTHHSLTQLQELRLFSRATQEFECLGLNSTRIIGNNGFFFRKENLLVHTQCGRLICRACRASICLRKPFEREFI